MDSEVVRLQADNAALVAEVARLRAALDLRVDKVSAEDGAAAATAKDETAARECEAYCPSHSLSTEQVQRYSRQLLLHSFGPEGQDALARGSVLIIGAGGLGSPAALYLAGSGLGRLGIADKDIVELSNLHRQVIHREGRVGMHKVDSAGEACRALNSQVVLDLHRDGIHPGNAVSLVEGYDVVLDCSDNPATRYLVNDACVRADRPLVSGAAVGTEGQLSVYHHGADGPCYRCLFPVPPKPENCHRCADYGVLGPVPGVIGTLQALEAVKLLSRKGDPLSKRLFIFDGLFGVCRTVKLRPRSPTCAACGDAPTLPHPSAFDYQAFTGGDADDAAAACGLTLLKPEQRLRAVELKEQLERSDNGDAAAAVPASSSSLPLLLDVRPRHEFRIASLPGSLNIPLKELQQRLGEVREAANAGDGDGRTVVALCRRGNDSQLAVQQLEEAGVAPAVDLINGLTAWHTNVDRSFPKY